MFLTQKRGYKVSGAGFAAAQPHPAHVHGRATTEQLLENKRACEKRTTETKEQAGTIKSGCWTAGKQGTLPFVCCVP